MPKQALAGYADIKPFGEGKIAIQICGSWAIGQLRNTYKDMVGKVGIAPMASMDGDLTKPTATLGGWSLAVDGKSSIRRNRPISSHTSSRVIRAS